MIFQSVSQLAHALNSEKFGDSSLVRIFWPKDRCPLLRDDVVLVDRFVGSFIIVLLQHGSSLIGSIIK